MPKRSEPPSVFDEPHRVVEPRSLDPSENRAARIAPDTRAQEAEHGVWDEPGLSSELVGPRAPGSLDYASWLEERWREISPARTWGFTLAAVALGGPCAVLAILLRPPDTFLAILAITVLGPLAEEIAKVALPLYAVEKRPFWFIVPVQIVVASVGSALCFAAIENVLYLKVYVPSPTPGLVIWRWTICVVLHTSCSLIASLGLVRVWHDVHETKQRPDLRRAVPFLIAAVVVHGVYNAGAVLAEAVNYQF